MTLQVEAMVLTPSQFKTIWNDDGSGASNDVQTWAALPSSDFFPLGDLAQSNSDSCIYDSEPLGSFIVLKDVSTDGDVALAAPEDFQCVWTDAGSGGDEDGSIWCPLPPNGFLAMGHMVMEGHDTKPDPSRYRCLSSRIAIQGQAGASIWNDKGSGAKQDVGLWGFGVSPAAPTGILLGTFIANNEHCTAPSSSSFDLVDPQFVKWVTP